MKWINETIVSECNVLFMATATDVSIYIFLR